MQKKLYNHNNFNLKKMMYIIITSVIMLCLACVTVNAAGSRKKITKTINDSMTVFSAYHYNYYFTAHAVLTYSSANSISSISDLAFTNVGYTASVPSLAANFIPKQISKSNNKSSATYVVQLTRSVYGYYTDKVNYTLTYKLIDSGVPYSNLNEDKLMILVDVKASEPYDIRIEKPYQV